MSGAPERCHNRLKKWLEKMDEQKKKREEEEEGKRKKKAKQ